MQPIIYDVAVSADGFICGPNGDVSAFPHEGPIVDDYRARLLTYGAVVMGRATYDVGLAHGLPPGMSPYPGLACHVVSRSLQPLGEVYVLPDLGRIAALRERADGPIYLCGGGRLAGALLSAGWIDEVILKRAPILLGRGVPLWGQTGAVCAAELREHREYGGGLTLQHYVLR